MKLILFLSIFGFVTSLQGATRSKPNIIYILLDDAGYGDLSCYGQKHFKTPNIDRLAEEGIKFTQHYSGSTVCAPTRSVLMTGLHTGHTPVRGNKEIKPIGQHPIPLSTFTLAEALKEKGYQTGAFGKWGLGNPGSEGAPENQGFDRFFGYNCQRHAHNHFPRFLWRNNKKVQLPGNDRKLDGKIHSQDAFTEEALSFIKQNKEDPFFLYLPFAIPHLSIQTTEKWLNEYKKVIPEEEYTHRGYLKHPFPRAGYAAMITQMDDSVGQVHSLVKELGLDNDTLIVFTSDNGPTFNRLGGSDSDFFKSAGVFKGLKGSLYEGGIRVPTIVRWPGKIKPGTISDHVSAFWDWMPTLSEIAETKAPNVTDGISLVPSLLGKKQKSHEFLYWEFPSYGSQQAVRLGNWKGIRQKISKAKTTADIKTELYNLELDPGETKNVANLNPKILEKIELIMVNEHVPSELFPILPEERLRARKKKLNKSN